MKTTQNKKTKPVAPAIEVKIVSRGTLRPKWDEWFKSLGGCWKPEQPKPQ